MMEGGIGSQEQVHHKHLTTGHSAKLTANEHGQSSNERNNHQLEPCHLSKGQYQQLIQFLNKDPEQFH